MKALIKAWIIISALFMLQPAIGGFANAADSVILVIESYHAEYPWDVSYKQAIEETLGGKYKLEYFQMDTKRLPAERHAEMADKAWEKYLNIKPVLVILGDDAALKHLGKRFENVNTPVVYLGINNNPRAYINIGNVANMTGVLERPLFKRNIFNLHEIYPKLQRALVLFDTDTTSQVILKEVFNGNSHTEVGTISVDLKLIGDWDTWKSTVLAAKGQYDIIMVGLYQTLRDSSNKNMNAEDVIRWTSENTPVPPFAFWDFAVGADKAVGGLVLAGKEQGKIASEIALQILSGTPPNQIIPKTAEKGRYLFSKKQLQKYNITLPPDIAKEASLID